MTFADATTELSTDEAFDVIARHKVGLTPALGLWLASCELRSPRKVGRPAQRFVSAIGFTPIGAVERLLLRLAAEPTERSLFDDLQVEN